MLVVLVGQEKGASRDEKKGKGERRPGSGWLLELR